MIPLGVNPMAAADGGAIQEFRARAALNGGPLILTTGRLIKRKGVSWFVDQVVPRLSDRTTYVVIGEGEEEAAIRSAAVSAGVSDRVRLLGRVSDELLAAAYLAADVFVMPNVPVAGDMEGFGLVALEAAASGLPVVASKLEGITEAVHHERNGLLVTPCAADEFVATLGKLLALPPGQRQVLGEAFRTYTMDTYSWDRAARRYVDTMRELVTNKR